MTEGPKPEEVETLEPIEGITFRDAELEDVARVARLIVPFVELRLLLPRGCDDLVRLMKHGFCAEDNGELVGFAAVEIYSSKLAEVQCLAVAQTHQGRGIGKRLVHLCVERARREHVLELMAITSSDHLFFTCGFDYSLPGQKRALFVRTREDDPIPWHPG